MAFLQYVCSISKQNCTGYPLDVGVPPFTNSSCAPYEFVNPVTNPTNDRDIGICGWTGAPCLADNERNTSNCNFMDNSICDNGVCGFELGAQCSLKFACNGELYCGLDFICGGSGASIAANAVGRLSEMCVSDAAININGTTFCVDRIANTTSSAAPSSTAAPTTTAAQHKRVPVGAIVGGAIGGAVLLGGALYAIRRIQWTKRKRETTHFWLKNLKEKRNLNFNEPTPL